MNYDSVNYKYISSKAKLTPQFINFMSQSSKIPAETCPMIGSMQENLKKLTSTYIQLQNNPYIREMQKNLEILREQNSALREGYHFWRNSCKEACVELHDTKKTTDE